MAAGVRLSRRLHQEVPDGTATACADCAMTTGVTNGDRGARGLPVRPGLGLVRSSELLVPLPQAARALTASRSCPYRKPLVPQSQATRAPQSPAAAAVPAQLMIMVVGG